MYERTYADLVRQNPLMKNTYYEYEQTKDSDPQPPRIRTHQLIKIPNFYDESPNAQPRFRWVTSEWSTGSPTPEMKLWDEKLRFTLGRMQGSY